MKAYFNEGYFHIHISESKELGELMLKPLEACLQEYFGDTNTAKKTILIYDKNADKPKIDISPKESPWSRLESISITITDKLFEKLKNEKAGVCEFDSGFSIDLYLGKEIAEYINEEE